MTPPKKLAVLECCPKPLWRKRKQRSPLRFPAGRRHNVKPCVPENTLATEAWRPMATAAADAAVARWSICAKSLDKSCLSGSRRGANTGLPSRLGAHRPCRGATSACVRNRRVLRRDCNRCRQCSGTELANAMRGSIRWKCLCRRDFRDTRASEKETGPRREPRAWDSLLASDRLDHQFGCSRSTGWSSPSIGRR